MDVFRGFVIVTDGDDGLASSSVDELSSSLSLVCENCQRKAIVRYFSRLRSDP
jgi:hypothetical protein